VAWAHLCNTLQRVVRRQHNSMLCSTVCRRIVTTAHLPWVLQETPRDT